MPPARPQSQTKKPQDHKPSRLRMAALALVILLAAVVPYARTLDFGFVWDDHFTIGKHLEIHAWSDVVRIWTLPFDTLISHELPKGTYFRPATLFSLAVDHALSPGNPRLFHATNVFLYAGVCLFLWLAAWELSGRPVASAAGTVLFALHPVHPESVAFISGRTDVLAGLFLFAALWAALRFGTRIRNVTWKLLPAAPLFLLSLFSKEIGFFATPLIPAALWVKERRLRPPEVARASIPVLAAALVYLAARIAVLQSPPLPAVTPVEGTVTQILTSVAVVARYVPLLLFPSALSARHETVETHAPDPVFFVGLLVLAAIGAGLVVALRRRSSWLVPLLLYAATLLPICYVRLLSSGAIVAERFLFIPSGSIALAAGLLPVLASRTESRSRRPERSEPGRPGPTRTEERNATDAGPGFLVASGVAALALFVLLVPRIALWRSDGALFLSMVRDSPESSDAHAIIASYFYNAGDVARAVYHYRRALHLHPQSHKLYLGLGAAEGESGQTDSAFAHIRLLNQLEPRYAPGFFGLGNLYARSGRNDSAAAAYRAALAVMPRFPPAENNLGAVLESEGRPDEALLHYRLALAIDPMYKDARDNYRRLYAEISESTRVRTSRSQQSARPGRPRSPATP
jgi:protein O-mannosyl-transferase